MSSDRGRLAVAFVLAAWLPGAGAFEPMAVGPAMFTPSFNARLGLNYGTGVNFGLGALDAIGERERESLYLVAKPRLDLALPAVSGTAYGGVSVVAATTQLDGEISGQWARSGDWSIDTDHAFVGWRNDVFDLSYGGQEFWVGDGFIIGDGNFNQGGEDGQYWTGAYAAWRNSAVLKINTRPLRADVFWLRTDEDFRDSRVAGINVETSGLAFGTLGAMYLEVFEGGAFNLNGIDAWNLRAANLKLPGIEHFELFGEWVLERGRDVQAGGRENDAVGWYVEGQYTFAELPWTPRFNYRYVRLSGDELSTPENEEYRGLFFTIFKRDWDTWYQGEIAGEYHLFNQNQVTQMFKLKTFPRPGWALGVWYFRHSLEEPQYLGTPTPGTRWADEINVGLERFIGDRFYGYLGVAWSTPFEAAEAVFGDDDFTVISTFISVTF